MNACPARSLAPTAPASAQPSAPPVRQLPECGVARFLILLDGPWATLIIRELLHGPRRFTQLRTALPGISPHTLTARLRRFELHEIVTRRSFPEIPPRVVYSLTPLGQRLAPVLEAMDAWGRKVSDKNLQRDSPEVRAP